MKKLIGTLVAALLAAAVFADVGIGAWGRGFWVPFAWDGEARMANAVGWAHGGPRVGVSMGGSSDNFGFAMDLKGDNGNIAINDNAFIWAKPWSWLKITIGQSFDDTLRSSCYFASWDWVRPSNAHGDDIIFARIDNRVNNEAYNPLPGVVLALAPVDGLYIAAGLNIPYVNFNYGTNEANAPKMGDIFKNSQYQIGYTIDAVMAIKAQYIGGVVSTNSDGGNQYATNPDVFAGTINAAVDLLMIEGSKISVGTYIGLEKDKDADIWVNAAYSGSFDSLSLGAYVMTHIVDNFGLNIGVGIGYDLGDGMAIEADVRADLVFGDNFNGSLSVGAYFSKGFSNGKCGIGAIIAAPLGEGATVGINNFDPNDKFHVAIPVKLEYWF